VPRIFDPNETNKNGVTFSSTEYAAPTLSRDQTGCIWDYINLTSVLERTAKVNSATVTLCPGTINVPETIHVSNMSDLIATQR
jgi:hypothetical protein